MESYKAMHVRWCFLSVLLVDLFQIKGTAVSLCRSKRDGSYNIYFLICPFKRDLEIDTVQQNPSQSFCLAN